LEKKVEGDVESASHFEKKDDPPLSYPTQTKEESHHTGKKKERGHDGS